MNNGFGGFRNGAFGATLPNGNEFKGQGTPPAQAGRGPSPQAPANPAATVLAQRRPVQPMPHEGLQQPRPMAPVAPAPAIPVVPAARPMAAAPMVRPVRPVLPTR